MSPEATYDVIVVGSGTAGCVIASRLTEDENARVLLLEAGPAEGPDAVRVPPAWPSLMEGPASWGEFTVRQAATGTAAPLPRGRGIGGSSAINAMMFVRGFHTSYDSWPTGGSTSWGFDDLLPYFKRSENVEGRDPALRGTGGPLTVGPAAHPNPVLRSCVDAAVESGYRRADDISGGMEEGFGFTDLNVVDGERQTAADAYLTPARDRPGLDVVADALVTRLRIDHGRCTGVEYAVDGEVVSAGCTGEVVLAAGAIGSAQLLMLSGVGPEAHLRQVGAETLLDLPGVGANFHDHPITNLVYEADRPVPAGRANHGEAFGMVRSPYAQDAPDLQILFIDAPGHMPAVGAPEEASSAVPPEQGYTIGAALLRPRSRGSVRLARADPGAPPLLDPDYFGDDQDLITMISGLRLAREIGNASALDEWRGAEVGPGSGVTDDDGLRGYVYASLASYCHPVGTCRMGDDAMAVVDEDLRVRGVTGLRVADGSVMPDIPSGNTNATVCAIAERAAELIRNA